MDKPAVVHPSWQVPGGLFNKPWMASLDQRLLVRYWRSKGCPGHLETKQFGIAMVHSAGRFGELVFVRDCYIE